MRILFAGATGVLGRATLPYLRRHEVVAITRTSKHLDLLEQLAAKGIVCDVYDYPSLLATTPEVRPDTIVNFLTALRDEPEQANNRIRREGAVNLLRAAEEANAARLVVESVAFPLRDQAAEAVEQLEHTARQFSGKTLILRFGRLWGPDTFHQAPPQPPAIHVAGAGTQAAKLITTASPGTYTVTEVSSDRS